MTVPDLIYSKGFEEVEAPEANMRRWEHESGIVLRAGYGTDPALGQEVKIVTAGYFPGDRREAISVYHNTLTENESLQYEMEKAAERTDKKLGDVIEQ